jgi:hypothetical protein
MRPYQKTVEGMRGQRINHMGAHLKFLPSCLRSEWKTTVRVGAFTPMANVSVQNSTCKGKVNAE